MVQDPEEKLLKIKNTQENREICHCKVCPSYPSKCGGEILYCGNGPSHCDVRANICICSTCPIYYEYELNGIYFCERDTVGQSRISMRKKNEEESYHDYNEIVSIKDISALGRSVVGSMGSTKDIKLSLDDLHFIPAQVNIIPLNADEPVNCEITIGKTAEKPLKLSSPILISGLSYGAVSKNTKLTIAETASKLNIGFNSGEGGVLEEELQAAENNLIIQYSTGRFGIDEDLLSKGSAVEIRFGQGAYPGIGSYLPAEKITPDVAEKRGLEKGEASYSPAHHPDILNHDDLKNKIKWLKLVGKGIPVGAKIGCGNIEDDVRVLAESGVDFIALDGFGGGTGATDKYVRENVGVPIIAAIPRAYKILTQLNLKNSVSLIAGGGLKTSADFAKCLALGADAVYTGTAALIAINCEQYRICFTGRCPTGITTQNPQLTKQLDLKDGVTKLGNFIEGTTKEIATFVRIVGKNDVSKLDNRDMVAVDRDVAQATGVKWINGEYS